LSPPNWDERINGFDTCQKWPANGEAVDDARGLPLELSLPLSSPLLLASSQGTL
jgi:hypothetical protein